MNTRLFHFINVDIANPFLDWFLPIFSERELAMIPLIAAAGFFLIAGSTRTRLAVAVLGIALALADFGSERVVKPLVNADRPHTAFEDVRVYSGGMWHQNDPIWMAFYSTRASRSFPSSHAANAAVIATVAGITAPASLVAGVPFAALVGLSRVYTGNHFPVDVAAGWLWGVACGLGVWWAARRAWRRWRPDTPLERRLFMPMAPARALFTALIALWIAGNLAFIHLDLFDLAADEAQYWDWSRDLELGYYSKPPMIAYVMKALTKLGGHNAAAIRSGAVLFSAAGLALIYALTLRITRKERTALLAAGAVMCMPSTWAGAVIMTIDPVLAFFWVAAMYCFHRAVAGDRGMWLATGLALGGGFLAKYTIVLLVAAFAAYLLLADRRWLRSPGPWLALGVAALCSSGVLYWNWANDWVSLRHTAAIGAPERWTAGKGLGWFAEFVGAQAGVVSPILFALYLWAMWTCARRMRTDRDAAFLFLCFAALFGFYAALAFTRAPNVNWPVCAYFAAAPGFAWVWRGRPRGPAARRWLAAGLALGCLVGAAPRATGLVYAAGIPLDPRLDPTNKLRGGREIGVALSRYVHCDKDGPFAFSDRYQMTAYAAFYTPCQPRVMCVNLGRRHNHYDLRGGWEKLIGSEGIFVTGGTADEARFWVEGLVYAGMFESGEFLEEVEVRRGNRVLHRYTLSRMRNYTGKVLTPERPEY